MGLSSAVSRVKLPLGKLLYLYDLLYKDDDEPEHVPAHMARFIRIWNRSEVFKIPSGFLRFEKSRMYPGITTVHGVFLRNPFYDMQTIKSVLDYYLELNNEISEIQCIANKHRDRGVVKLVRAMGIPESEVGKAKIFSYRRS